VKFQILTCRRCVGPVTFTTANELAEHHLTHHERLVRRDGTLLVAITSDDVIGYVNGAGPPQDEEEQR
jgi:hypothetical protein